MSAKVEMPVDALPGCEELEEEEGEMVVQEKPVRRTHAKSASLSEKERKIGHRRINEEGQVSYKKIETNQLMGSIQLGVHDSVGGLAMYPERDLLMHDFMTIVLTQFPNKGGSQTPGHSYSDFVFRTYAPMAFRYFRDLFGIPPDVFMMSICHEPLRELSNPGASGSIFYLTSDDEFILKTVSSKEAEFLQKLLPGYYMNLQQNPRTLLPKFFGMFTYQCNQKNIRLIVMNNLLPSNVKLHLKFDLKGSTYKRKASRREKAKKSPTFKDLDFMELLPEGLIMEPEIYNQLMNTMKRDCRVLESFKIMDYSLLVGVHNLDQAIREREERNSASPVFVRQQSQRQKLVAHSTAMESIQVEKESESDAGTPPGGIPARTHKGDRVLVYIGLIDILQSYRLSKKLEHTFKAMIHDGDTVSVHRPGFYAERFLTFMSEKVFRKAPESGRGRQSPSKRHRSVKTKGQGVWARQEAGRPDVVPNTELTPEKRLGDSIARLEDVTLESRDSQDSLSTPTKARFAHTSTPSWTEGTPSYTESSYSGETPVKKVASSSVSHLETRHHSAPLSEQHSLQSHEDTRESIESVVTKL